MRLGDKSIGIRQQTTYDLPAEYYIYPYRTRLYRPLILGLTADDSFVQHRHICFGQLIDICQVPTQELSIIIIVVHQFYIVYSKSIVILQKIDFVSFYR